MDYIYLIDLMTAEKIAKLRSQSKENRPSSNPLSPNYQLNGVKGEMGFAQYSGIPVDTRILEYGDGGIDFTLASGLTVDVKGVTYHPPKCYLLCEVGKIRADIYVLAYIDGARVRLLGWATAQELNEAPIDAGNIFKHGLNNRYLHYNQLNPMDEFLTLM